MSTDLLMIASLLALIAAAGVLGAAEAALLRVSPVRVEVRADGGERGAARVLPLLDDLPRVMNTILRAVLLAQIAAATLAGTLAARHFGNLGITISSIVTRRWFFTVPDLMKRPVPVWH